MDIAAAHVVPYLLCIAYLVIYSQKPFLASLLKLTSSIRLYLPVRVFQHRLSRIDACPGLPSLGFVRVASHTRNSIPPRGRTQELLSRAQSAILGAEIR